MRIVVCKIDDNEKDVKYGYKIPSDELQHSCFDP